MKKIVVFIFFICFSSCGCRETGKGEKWEVKKENLCLTPEVEKIISQHKENVPIKILSEKDIKEMNYIPPENGGALKALEGDILVETEDIIAVIQGIKREIGPFTYGGNLIDLSPKDEEYKKRGIRDILGEINILLFLGQTLKPDFVGKLKDGIIVASGKLDILDYINVPALAKTILPSLQIETDKDIKAKVSNYYLFYEKGRTIRFITTICVDENVENVEDEKILQKFFWADIIDSGGDGEFFIPSSPLHFGYAGASIGPLSAFKTNWFAFISRTLNSSYAIFPPSSSNVSVIVSGVGVLGYSVWEEGKDTLSILINLLQGKGAGIEPLNPGDKKFIERYVVVGNSSPSSLLEEYLRVKGVKTYEIRGKVNTKSTVAILRKEGKEKILYTVSDTDNAGNFTLRLPEGDYIAYAEAPQSIPSQPYEFSIPSQNKIELSLNKGGKILVSAYEVNQNGTTSTVPAKVSFVCIGECPKKICWKEENCPLKISMFRDITYDPFPAGVQYVSFIYGKTEIPLPAGRYKVVISRGMEYSVYEEEITLGEGEVKEVNGFITKVAPALGWISADTHVHAVNSPDSPVNLIDRVMTFAGEGVDIIISTDHDFITDYSPTISLMKLQNFLDSLPGQEITTFTYGHFNAYPLSFDVNLPQNGAIDWTDKYDNFKDYGISEDDKEKYRFLRALHPEEIIKKVRLKKPQNISRNIIQINHPRSGGMGYIDLVKLDTFALSTLQDPCIHRIFPPLGKCSSASDTASDTKLWPQTQRFDAIEVYNSYFEIPIVLNDWMTFLNLGKHLTAVGCSDTHKRIITQSGIARTFVKVSTEPTFPLSPEVKNQFVENLYRGNAFVSNGIILQDFKVCGNRGNEKVCAEMGGGGEKITPTTILSEHKVKVKVISPHWVYFDKLEIFSNTPNTAVKGGEKNSNWPSPFFSKSISPVEKIKIIGGKTIRYYEYEDEIALPLLKDSWIVLIVRCSELCGPDKKNMFPVIADRGVLPILISNPIYVDVDGDGNFTPPGASYYQKAPPHYHKEKSFEEVLKEFHTCH